MVIQIKRSEKNAHILIKLECEADKLNDKGVTYREQLLDALESNLNLRREVLRLARDQVSPLKPIDNQCGL